MINVFVKSKYDYQAVMNQRAVSYNSLKAIGKSLTLGTTRSWFAATVLVTV